MVGCKTQHETITTAQETNGHVTQTRRDSTRLVDLTVIHDTIAILRTETLWRKPDSLGRIYPLTISSTETSSKRQTTNNITTSHIDLLSVIDENDHTATSIAKSTAGYSPPAKEGSPFLNWLPWLVMGVLICLRCLVISAKILRVFPATYVV